MTWLLSLSWQPTEESQGMMWHILPISPAIFVWTLSLIWRLEWTSPDFLIDGHYDGCTHWSSRSGHYSLWSLFKSNFDLIVPLIWPPPPVIVTCRNGGTPYKSLPIDQCIPATGHCGHFSKVILTIRNDPYPVFVLIFRGFEAFTSRALMVYPLI